MTGSLGNIRAEIVARLEQAEMAVTTCDAAALDAHRRLDLATTALAAHDRAVAAMNSAAQPAPVVRKERRDIAALVLGALTDQPQTVTQIAHAIGVQPGRVEVAVAKVGVRAYETADSWVRPNA
jgi:hypothetical protein